LPQKSFGDCVNFTRMREKPADVCVAVSMHLPISTIYANFEPLENVARVTLNKKA
jgi:hypothetical protein